MGLFELLFKRRRFLPLYERVWDAVSPHLAITAGPEEPIPHRLACFYYGSVVYASVYQTALAAGMSTSSGYALARLHLGKYPFDGDLGTAVDALFTADAGSPERRWGDTLQDRLGRIVAAVKAGGAAAASGVATELEALAEDFATLAFGGGDLYPPHPPEV